MAISSNIRILNFQNTNKAKENASKWQQERKIKFFNILIKESGL
jgi:hypothetical protein